MSWFLITRQTSTRIRRVCANIDAGPRALWAGSLAAVIISLFASGANAKGMFEMAGGVAIPTGHLANMAETGFSIGAMVGRSLPEHTFGVCVDYRRYGQKDISDSAGAVDSWMFTLCDRRTIAKGQLSPYFRIFLGAGRVDDELEVIDQNWGNWGIAVGAGLGLDLRRNAGIHWMVELVPKVIGVPGPDNGLVGFPSLDIRLGGWFEYGGTNEGK